MSYKIIGKYIKELNFVIPNPKTFSLLSKNIANYKINSEAVPLVKSFVLRTLLSLSVINFLAILLVKYDTNMPEGISEDMKIYPMIMHGVLCLLPLIALYRMSQKKIGD